MPNEILPNLNALTLFPQQDWLYQTPQAASVFFDGVSPSNVTSGELNASVQINSIASGSLLNIQGWTSTLTFSATDHNTIAWSAGAITLSDGTVFNIDAGNTGDISAINYIYFDKAVSETVLQKTTTAANAVGSNKILVGVAQNNADTGKKAVYQIFGGKGGSSQIVTADNIAANAVTANEIATNTITANQIDTGAITADEIAADAVTATKIDVATLSAISANIGTITAGTLQGVLFQSTTGNNRVEMTTGDLIAFYYSNINVGQIDSWGVGADGGIEIGSNDPLHLSAEGGDPFVVRGDRLVPYDDGTKLIGESPLLEYGSFSAMNAYTYYDNCLWLDEEDDIAILRQCQPRRDKKGNYILDEKSGKPRMDNTSLPEWMNGKSKMLDDIEKLKGDYQKRLDKLEGMIAMKGFKKKEKDKIEKDKEKLLAKIDKVNNYTEEDIDDATQRNLGHFLDLVAGAVRQLADRLDILEAKLNENG